MSVEKVKNARDGILRRHDFAWRFVLRSRSDIADRTARCNRECWSFPRSEVAFVTHTREKKTTNNNAGGRRGFITRVVFHSAALFCLRELGDATKWSTMNIYHPRYNNSSHFIDIYGIRNLELFTWKILARYTSRELYDKLISHIYHAAKRKLESLRQKHWYILLDIALFNILKRSCDIYKNNKSRNNLCWHLYIISISFTPIFISQWPINLFEVILTLSSYRANDSINLFIQDMSIIESYNRARFAEKLEKKIYQTGIIGMRSTIYIARI